ncbi:anthranilate O-methyltransferase 2-like [Papaver somniferum]|nr:anthranilate O-methyltransferase 2-like [Papaver somniferum]
MNQVIQNLHMNGSTGETSYAFNSSVQKKAFYKAKPMIEEAALDIFSKFYTCRTTEMTEKSTMPLGIADLGCSSGPNTLLNIIYKKCCELDIVSPCTLMIFLETTFNTLFKYLEGFCDELIFQEIGYSGI